MSRDVLSDLDFIDEQGRASLRELGAELSQGRVVLFAGAGLSMNAKRKDGGHQRLPGWWSLVEQLRAGLESDLAQEQDALRIADYFRAARGRNALVNAVMGAIPDAAYIPGPVHRRVVELSFQEIITTNFDTLIERAFEEAHIVPQVVVEGRDLARPRQPPRIIKMNGCLARNPGDIVISGDDFLSYGERHRLIQVFITRCFVESRVLFVGFSLDDPAFRAIQDWVRQRLGDDVPMAWSLHMSTTATQRAYWQQRGVDLINLSAGDTSANPEQKLLAVLDALLSMQRRAEPPPAGRTRRRALSEMVRSELTPWSLRPVSRLDGWSAGGLYLTRESWMPVAEVVDQALLSPDLTPPEVVVCADLALRLSAICALPDPDPSGEDPLSLSHCPSRLILAARALARLEPSAIDGLDPALRARALLLVCLLGPVSLCRRLVDRWSEMGDGALTADLDRLTVLSFHGVLSARPGLTQRAAEQLRLTGQPDAQDGSPRATEASLRYLHLIRAVGSSVWDWPVSHLYRERLERVAGHMLLDQTARAERGPVRSLLALLRALAQGALFIGPPPEELGDLWASVSEAELDGTRDLPWLALITLALPLEGEDLVRNRGRLLGHAWRQGDLNAEGLIAMAEVRLSGGGFEGLPDRIDGDRPASDRGAGRYACGLAALLRWLVDRVDEEAGPLVEPHLDLRHKFLDSLGEPLTEWLVRTPYPEVRSHLLHLWAVAGRWPGAPRAQVVRRWIDRHLDGPSPLQSMQLSLLDAPGQGMAADRDRIRVLLALAQSGRRRGTAFRHDLQRWLIAHAQVGALDEGALELLARHLAECLVADAEGPGFYWLSLASRIRHSDVLTGGLAVHLGAPGHPRSLASFIAERFDALDEDGLRRWGFSRAAYLSCLVPFALAGELIGGLEAAVGDLSPQGDWSRDGMEGAVALLAARMQAEPDEEAHREAIEGWIALGATGRGALGPVAHRLSDEARRTLQTQLNLALDDEGRHRPEEVVGGIQRTLATAQPGALPDLEAGLITAIFRRHPGVAIAALDGLSRLVADDARGPGILDRHRDTITRTVPVVRRRAQHRPTSRFMAQLRDLER